MKFFAEFVKTTYQIAEVEFETENEEAAKAILEDESNDIWYEAAEKAVDHPDYAPKVELVRLEEKSVHDDRVRDEEEKLLMEMLPF